MSTRTKKLIQEAMKASSSKVEGTIENWDELAKVVIK